MITEIQLIELLDDVISLEHDISFNKNKIKELIFNNEKLEKKQQELRKKIEKIVIDFKQSNENINNYKDAFNFELTIKDLLDSVSNELKNLSNLIELKGIDKYGYLLDFRKYCYFKYNNYLTLDFNYFNQEGNPDIDLECSEIYTDILSLLKDIQFEKNKLENN